MSQISEIIRKYLPALREPGMDGEANTPTFRAAVNTVVTELKALPQAVLREELELQASLLGLVALNQDFSQHILATCMGEEGEQIHPDTLAGTMLSILLDDIPGAEAFLTEVETEAFLAEGTQEGRAPFPAGGVPDAPPQMSDPKVDGISGAPTRSTTQMGSIAAPSND